MFRGGTGILGVSARELRNFPTNFPKAGLAFSGYLKFL
jgi:hypothetical protein